MTVQGATFMTGAIIGFAGFMWWSYAVMVDQGRGHWLSKAMLVAGGLAIIASLWMGVSS